MYRAEFGSLDKCLTEAAHGSPALSPGGDAMKPARSHQREVPRSATYDAEGVRHLARASRAMQCHPLRPLAGAPATLGGPFATRRATPRPSGREWLTAPHGCGETGHPSGLAGTPEWTAGVRHERNAASRAEYVEAGYALAAWERPLGKGPRDNEWGFKRSRRAGHRAAQHRRESRTERHRGARPR